MNKIKRRDLVMHKMYPDTLYVVRDIKNDEVILKPVCGTNNKDVVCNVCVLEKINVHNLLVSVNEFSRMHDISIRNRNEFGYFYTKFTNKPVMNIRRQITPTNNICKVYTSIKHSPRMYVRIVDIQCVISTVSDIKLPRFKIIYRTIK